MHEDHRDSQIGCFTILLRVLCAFFVPLVVKKKRELNEIDEPG